MNRKALLKGFIFALGAFCLQSCTEEFNSIGTEVIGDENFNTEKYSVQNILAYNQVSGSGHTPGAVESSNLPSTILGSYKDPFFGTTTSSFATQVHLPLGGVNIPTESKPQIDSVYFYVPYYSTFEKTDENDNRIYKLNNVYGAGKFNLKVYENGYFLNNFNAEGNGSKKYYSDEQGLVENLKKGQPLNNSGNTAQNSDFFFNNNEIILYKYKADGTPSNDPNTGKQQIKERLAPGMWLDLDKEYFTKLLLSPENQAQLNNNELFRDFFRGLYFKVETETATAGTLGQLNISGAKLVVIYSHDNEKDKTKREKKTLEFKLPQIDEKSTTAPTSYLVNFFNNTYSPAYLQGITAPNKVQGDEKLFLKGGSGSFSVIELFGKDNDNNGVADELDFLRKNKWLINDARLTFYVDTQSMAAADQFESNRIYLYDLNNNRPIVDYSIDTGTDPATGFAKPNYRGILEKVKAEDNKGIRYRIKLTEHIANLIRNDTVTNVKLGLVVSSNISLVRGAALKTSINNNPKAINSLPISSITQPIGTVLHGFNSTDEAKKMKFEIFYSKPKN